MIKTINRHKEIILTIRIKDRVIALRWGVWSIAYQGQVIQVASGSLSWPRETSINKIIITKSNCKSKNNDKKFIFPNINQVSTALKMAHFITTIFITHNISYQRRDLLTI